jgi:predicted tellurium resistance membrane protein TerC
MELLADPHTWIALFTLTALELVLGIDNIIFISILVDRLPPQRRELARRLGLGLAMLMRLLLLFALSWVVELTAPLFTAMREEISGRDLVLLLGGAFLIWKATSEIHDLVQGDPQDEEARPPASSFAGVLVQIMIIDLVFSLDSIITAVGMVDEIKVMVAAVILSVAIMMLFAGAIGRFVSSHPTVKTLALSFLIMVGMALVADGLDFHVPKGYIYFAMAFSVGVEVLNLRMRRNLRRYSSGKPRPRSGQAR